MTFKVKVTKTDLKRGKEMDCFRCPVAIALQRSTKDREASVTQDFGGIRLCAWGRVIEAPGQAIEIVLGVDCGNRGELKPVAFELPDINEWQEQCYGCQEIFEQSELDEQGFCEECRHYRS